MEKGKLTEYCIAGGIGVALLFLAINQYPYWGKRNHEQIIKEREDRLYLRPTPSPTPTPVLSESNLEQKLKKRK